MASQILRVTIRGSMPGTEVWSVNPCWEIDGPTGSLVTNAECATIAAALVAVTPHTSMLTALAPGTKITGYRVEARKVTGQLDAQSEAAYATPVDGTGASLHPYGTAIAISLRSSLGGPRGRGRLYWPATGQGLNPADYRLSVGNAANVLTGAKSYLTAMQTAIRATLPNADLTVWSRTSNNFSNVVQIQVGNVLDSQRRRRDALFEAYQAVAYP